MNDDKLMMKKISITLVIILSISLNAVAEEKQIIGWIEKVHIYPGRLSVRAKIDTGAKISSINAPEINKFKRNGNEWISFTVENQKGKRVKIEKEIVRATEIKRKLLPIMKRPVIMLGICLGDIYKEVEVNLVDRSNFNYQVLIGRNFLTKDYIVDPSLTFTKKPSCKKANKNE